jgi:hypothetical protein
VLDGNVTCFFVKDDFYLIGTSKGVVLIYGEGMKLLHTIHIVSPTQSTPTIFDQVTSFIPLPNPFGNQ